MPLADNRRCRWDADFHQLGAGARPAGLELGSLCTQLTPNMFAPQEILFEPQAFKCESRHKNLIGFKCEVALFRRVLQAAGAHDAECVEVLWHSGRVWLQHMVVLLFRHLSPVPVQVCIQVCMRKVYVQYVSLSSGALVVVDEAVLCYACFYRRYTRYALLLYYQADMKSSHVMRQVKLAMRTMPGACNGSQGGAKPFLTFTCRGPNLNMVQDLPISKPHSPSQVDELLAANAQGGADATGMMCPLYLDLLPVAPRLLVRRSRREPIMHAVHEAVWRTGRCCRVKQRHHRGGWCTCP